MHTTLQDFEDVTTESFGNDTERFVRIIPLMVGDFSNTDPNATNDESNE